MAPPVKTKRAGTAGRARAERTRAAETNGDIALTKNDLKRLLAAFRAAKQGDFSVRVPAATDSGLGEVAVAFNELASSARSFRPTAGPLPMKMVPFATAGEQMKQPTFGCIQVGDPVARSSATSSYGTA